MRWRERKGEIATGTDTLKMSRIGSPFLSLSHSLYLLLCLEDGNRLADEVCCAFCRGETFDLLAKERERDACMNRQATGRSTLILSALFPLFLPLSYAHTLALSPCIVCTCCDPQVLHLCFFAAHVSHRSRKHQAWLSLLFLRFFFLSLPLWRVKSHRTSLDGQSGPSLLHISVQGHFDHFEDLLTTTTKKETKNLQSAFASLSLSLLSLSLALHPRFGLPWATEDRARIVLCKVICQTALSLRSARRETPRHQPQTTANHNQPIKADPSLLSRGRGYGSDVQSRKGAADDASHV